MNVSVFFTALKAQREGWVLEKVRLRFVSFGFPFRRCFICKSKLFHGSRCVLRNKATKRRPLGTPSPQPSLPKIKNPLPRQLLPVFELRPSICAAPLLFATFRFVVGAAN